MNTFKQHLIKNNLSYCTLYPNISNVFPLELNVSDFVTCCSLKELSDITDLHIQDQHWKEIKATFDQSSICFCFKESILLIRSWDGISDSYQKLNLTQMLYQAQIHLENYDVHDTIFKKKLDFSFHEMESDIPWINSHIFLLNTNWTTIPQTAPRSYWVLKVEYKKAKSDWESVYRLSFNIIVEDQVKVMIPLYYNTLEDLYCRQGEIVFLK